MMLRFVGGNPDRDGNITGNIGGGGSCRVGYVTRRPDAASLIKFEQH
jgi:hypothetical protein